MKHTLVRLAALLLAPLTALHAAERLDFVRDVRPIFEQHCYECHSGTEQESGLRLDVKEAAFKGGDNHGPDIVPGMASESPLIRFLSADDDSMMPPGEKLSDSEIDILTRWINEGADWPDGVDRVQIKDKRDHWSFKPLAVAAGTPSIDDFIAMRLSEHELEMSPEAEPVTWLRRVTFDLTGLPPTPDEVHDFQRQLASRQGGSAETDDDRGPVSQNLTAYTAVVDRLLASERYGEHWAQHWLDVVRYADTHGFEVNTERPNAWPYRDYVIRAFNKDTPYDRFIKEQLVGDAIGEDTATGFLITASVLLPGQIGKDAPSIRLARQDSLDEIVNNIGQTFLGLSIGCARCHDHKFDPITAKDYYAAQAFVAGVEYADREILSPETDAKEKLAETMRIELREINDRLAKFVPLARPGLKQRLTHANENIESFNAVEAKFVRFTIHDANLHPSLGLIEPCIDEFEIFTDEPEPRNVAFASHGTKTTASGSRTSAAHKLEHINDGKFGNARSWMSDTAGRGWVLFELPQPARISKVVWSRDRNGQLSDRLPTAFTLEAGLTVDAMTTVAEVSTPRHMVAASTINTDRFQPVRTRSLRFTILNTNSLDPCLDELEVFTAAGENIALASAGTTVKTSGDIIVANRHDPSYLNDGQFGNERSWLGNESGKGWVEFEFPAEQEITRVHWSRDREGKHQDRLAIDYKIEVRAGDDWMLVADSSDRQPYLAGATQNPAFTLSGLAPEEARAATQLLAKKSDLEARLKVAETRPVAFAGTFRQPDQIHLLMRGDPEQPQEEVLPAVLSALGDVALSPDTTEQDRRHALADWIASPQNPLTARVMVNRIWQGHFGAGLVDTPSDMGNNGSTPTHPQLLDWLAAEFIDSGWSVKRMHQLIVLSKTYRQSSTSEPQSAEIDADVRWLWRYPSRRMEAESIRDSMLAVSGRLDLTMYGRGFDLFDQRGGLSGFTPVETLTPENQRRMIYAHKVRRESEAVFGAFDCPDAGQSTAVRRASTTPIQALNLFNSRFTLEASTAFADRVKAEVGDDVAMQINRAYELALNRLPIPAEQDDAMPVVQKYGLPVLCRALFNSNEFLFIP